MIAAFAGSAVASALDAALLALAATPTPAPDFDTNTVSPGVAGFLITFGVALVAVLLMVDMVRRVRRTRYREDIRAQLEEEQRAAGGETRPEPGSGGAIDGTDSRPERPPGS
ncbi:hypothetical protein [Planctomonas psychrotolerans]|uniref:hypothetical protein n=1 Tax=Planctomonas psychrotolerans TaxID=2528712 RepID=UPI00123BCC08|nr:hypothetical protein [Planctomonas psychrotolerans]